MSLNTLLEAAKFLELQEQQQQHKATLESALATIRPIATLQNTSNTPQTITLTQSKPNICTAPPQTVLISNSNISSTLLQGPITFATTTATAQQPQIVKKLEQDGQISSTTPVAQNQRHRVLHNSFDIMNPLIIDESTPVDQKKIKQPPLVFRAGTREVHNKLEKHRRAHLKECFDILKKQLPSNGDEKKTSNLSILHSALRYIQTLKRRERELEHEMERLAREKISAQQRLAVLKKEISLHYDNVDFSKLLPEVVPTPASITDINTNTVSSSTTTAISMVRDVAIPEGIMSEVKLDPVAVPVSLQVTQPNAVVTTVGGNVTEKITIPILSKASLPVALGNHIHTPVTNVKEVTQPVQTTALSVLPMSYPVNQGLVLQKVAIVPHKGITDLTPLVQTHFIATTPQQLNGINGQLNGKVVPLAQYLVKPVVVVSTASPRPSS